MNTETGQERRFAGGASQTVFLTGSHRNEGARLRLIE
jgi:hypothetical protein